MGSLAVERGHLRVTSRSRMHEGETVGADAQTMMRTRVQEPRQVWEDA